MFDTKQMYVADLNVVFGKNEEPLIKWVDNIVLPALSANLGNEESEKTTYIFDDIKLKEIEENEYIIQGILIKDTVLEVMSEYTKDKGLEKKNKRIKSSPYSIFMIYLRNHRMVLVKNQNGSPDIRSFGSAFKNSVKRYVTDQNNIRKSEGKDLYPMPKTHIAGIKTTQSVKESLKDVEKIQQLIFKFYPLNSEWDCDSMFGEIDEKIRKTISSKKGRMIFQSPESKEGVAKIIEATEGLVKTEMKVLYNSDVSLTGTKRKGTIKDSEISEVMNIDITSELDQAYEEIYMDNKKITALNFQTENSTIDYQEFLRRRKK